MEWQSSWPARGERVSNYAHPSRARKRPTWREPTPDGRTVAEWLVDNMISHAMTGNAACMKEIMDRVEGKIPDATPPAPAIDMEMIARILREKRDQRRARQRRGVAIAYDEHGNPIEP
jgi:hypothetical protein